MAQPEKTTPAAEERLAPATPPALPPPVKIVRYNDIVERMEKYIPKFDPESVHRAYVYAAAKHRGQTRRSGEPYLNHPLQVAHLLADMELEPTCVIAGLLHDVVEDTGTELAEIEEMFGGDAASLVDGVTKLNKFSFTSKEAEQAENFRKLILAMAGDIRVLLIKLADRLHNMRTLKALPEKTQERKARETLEIYAPLAYRLGMGRLKGELEELSFEILYPREHEALTVNLEEKRRADKAFITGIERTLKEALAKHGIKAAVLWRVKTTYSVYKKIVTKHVALDEVYDYLAFRIITEATGDEGVQDCYRVMGVLHGLWKHVPGRIKDFLAIPKPNNYRSLHTTLMTGEGQAFEVQIRTRDMHVIAEEGIAAHWRYKEGRAAKPKEDEEMYRWLRRTVAWLQDVQDPRDFIDSMKLDLYPAEVYAFTPKGDVYSLPRGATPIDFAYRIHTDVGHRCTGAKVNGRMAPLDTALQNGDVVEVMTGKAASPSKDWLQVAATSKARAKIKAWFGRHEKERSVMLGKDILEKFFRRHKESLRNVLDDSARTAEIYSSFGVAGEDDLYAAVGYGKALPRSVYEKCFPDRAAARKAWPASARESAAASAPEKAAERARGAIQVRGTDDLLIALASCCHPLPGEDVVGYVTRGRGISVHRRTCPNMKTLLLTPERITEVEWAKGAGAEASAEGATAYPARLVVYVTDRMGTLAGITASIAEKGMNIREVKSVAVAGGRNAIHLTVETPNLAHLKRVMEALRRVQGVLDVERV